jgi:LPXTG-motif cell wall-anchored protein
MTGGNTLTARKDGRLGVRMAVAVFIGLVGLAVSGPAMAGDNAKVTAPGQSATAKAGQANEKASAQSQKNTPPASGDLTAPQPASHADFTGHGANVQGPYDSTRDGSPSMNGNGNGTAVGKPCAGCVGKADNKNPPGQMSGGTDPNAGYECDSNHGVGRSNPAHTACQPSPGNGDDDNGDDDNGNGDHDNGNGDHDNGNGDHDNGNGKGDDRNGNGDGISDDGNGAVTSPPDQEGVLPVALPKTGATMWLLPVGAGLVLVGGIAMAAGRRRPQH